MDRRKKQRLELEMPVRIWGVDRMSQPFSEIVRARKLSEIGAALTGVRARIQAGQVLEVQSGESHAECRIMWTNADGDAGIEVVEADAPWDAKLPKVLNIVGAR